MNRMSNYTYILRKFVDWWTRVRSIPYGLIYLGVGLLIAVLAGLSFSLNIPTAYGPLAFSFSTDAGLAAWLTYAIVLVAILLIVIGIARLRQEWAASDRRRVFVIELRGLRDWNGPPLSESVPNVLIGRRELVPIDVRQKVSDGQIIQPEMALQRVSMLRTELDSRENGLDRKDISYVFGGLAPVPLTFLAGVLIDDESPVTIMDWDRHQKRWRELDGTDDGNRFRVSGLETIGTGSTTAVVAISASYKVDVAGARAKCGPVPLVHLELENASTDSHWSEEKQQALSKQFLDVAVDLAGRGIRDIHLFFAGPSSLVARFGSHYDKRNLPAPIVYQYEQGQNPPFPWGVRMPVAGVVKAEIVGL